MDSSGTKGTRGDTSGQQDNLPFGTDDELPQPELVLSSLYPSTASTPKADGDGHRSHPPRSRARQLWRIGAAVSSVLLVSLLLLQTLGPSLRARLFPPPATPTPYQAAPMRVDASGLTCVHDLTWSPSGQQFALLGQRAEHGCIPDEVSIGASSVGEVVTLYDGHTGQLLRRLVVDTPIYHALRLSQLSQASKLPAASSISAAPSSTEAEHLVFLYFDSVRWSPTGNELAVLFTAELPTSAARRSVGLLLLDAHTGKPERVLQAEVTAPRDSAVTVIWDLRGGEPVVLGASAPYGPSGPSDIGHLPALTYAWDQGGRLRAGTPLTAEMAPPSPPPGPVGNPSAASAFTIWQPGMLQVAFGTPEDTTTQATDSKPRYQWYTTIPAWSPDGRYLFASLQLQARFDFAPSAATASPGSGSRPGEFGSDPLLPVRDGGLRTVLAAVPVTRGDPNYHEEIGLAWRPDGRMLAAFGPHPVVQVYSCRDGRKLAVLDPSAGGLDPVPFPRDASLLSGLRWSPDGANLLLVQGHLGVFLWRLDRLGV
jgi:hypothetical protein